MVGFGRRECPIHIVADAQYVTGEIARGIEGGFRLLALGALAQIIHLGERAQKLVLAPAGFFLEFQDLGIARVDLGLGQCHGLGFGNLGRLPLFSHGIFGRVFNHDDA